MIDAVTEVLALAEAPDDVRLAAVRRAGGRCAIDLVFDYALDVPPHDPEAVRCAVVLIDRIRVVLCHATLDRHSSAGVDRLAGSPPAAQKSGMSPLVKSRGPGQMSGGAIRTPSPFTR